MSQPLRIATLNIHKGVMGVNSRLSLHRQRELIRKTQADIVFLQEVCGEKTNRHFSGLYNQNQHEFLADQFWNEFAYGKNAITSEGHHGNAILSRFPILKWENEDISAHQIEQRGMLHSEIAVPDWDQSLHCICVHLGLFGHWRSRQLLSLRERIEAQVPKDAPLIIAGDFNDWRMQAGRILQQGLHLKEVFEPARSYPAILPIFRLDRIYTRGFHIQHTEIHGGSTFSRVSDHAALSATMTRL